MTRLLNNTLSLILITSGLWQIVHWMAEAADQLNPGALQ